MVVNGAYRGTRAVIQSIDMDHFCATVKIDEVRVGEAVCPSAAVFVVN